MRNSIIYILSLALFSVGCGTREYEDSKSDAAATKDAQTTTGAGSSGVKKVQTQAADASSTNSGPTAEQSREETVKTIRKAGAYTGAALGALALFEWLARKRKAKLETEALKDKFAGEQSNFRLQLLTMIKASTDMPPVTAALLTELLTQQSHPSGEVPHETHGQAGAHHGDHHRGFFTSISSHPSVQRFLVNPAKAVSLYVGGGALCGFVIASLVTEAKLPLPSTVLPSPARTAVQQTIPSQAVNYQQHPSGMPFSIVPK